ncbi:hypothetical protein J6590_029579 [Homalodisca vitripennis]|nr:hypothetical protein J6590_029579 [Homalodisca vitripennis]
MEKKTVVIQTKLGQLRGLVCKSILTEKDFYSFRGIPYGKPPLGELRFKAAQPFGSWEGVRDALDNGPDPKQPPMGPIEVPGMDLTTNDEDCLYINVYMNELPTKDSVKKPVLFSIHGGAFLVGSGGSKMNGAEHLLYDDVVVVAFNYRCGAFGFLSLENEEVPGNAGLKDQTLALKWVHDNIESFGGDPNNITIFGISAGGYSVGFHLVSPSSRGLFHKAIMQSGSPMNSLLIQDNPRSQATKLAKTLGCTSDDPDTVLQFLQSVPADDIVAATKTMSKEKEAVKKVTLIFTPSVEVSGNEPFLTDDPDKLMKTGQFAHVPVIIGCCAHESSVIAMFDGVCDETFNTFNENPEWLVSPCLELKPGSANAKEAQKAIWDFYLKGKPISWDNLTGYMNYQSDNLFVLGMHLTRKELLKKSKEPVYTYLFSNHSRCICQFFAHFLPAYASILDPSRTCHGADSLFTYGSSEGLPLSPVDKEAIKKHVKAWTAFASTGNPNADELGATWKNDSIAEPCYMDIASPWALKEGVIFSDRMCFWEKLLSKYSNS